MNGYAAGGFARGLMAGARTGLDIARTKDYLSDNREDRKYLAGQRQEAGVKKHRKELNDLLVFHTTNDDGSPKEANEIDWEHTDMRLLVNANPETRELFASGENVDQAQPFNGLVRGDNNRYAIRLNTIKDGTPGTEPMTQKRSADPNDKVVMSTPEELLRGLKTGYASWGFSNKASPEMYAKNQQKKKAAIAAAKGVLDKEEREQVYKVAGENRANKAARGMVAYKDSLESPDKVWSVQGGVRVNQVTGAVEKIPEDMVANRGTLPATAKLMEYFLAVGVATDHSEAYEKAKQANSDPSGFIAERVAEMEKYQRDRRITPGKTGYKSREMLIAESYKLLEDIEAIRHQTPQNIAAQGLNAPNLANAKGAATRGLSTKTEQPPNRKPLSEYFGK